MFAYIGLFSGSFELAIVLWPFVSALLTLPILAVLYHRDHRLRLASSLAAYTAVLYALGLLAFTLYPMPDHPALFCATHHYGPQLNILEIIPDLEGGLYSVLQVLMNVVFFMPMGYMLRRWARWPFWVSTLFALGCSVFIETSQLTGFWGVYPCAYRHFDVDDMLTNTVGAMCGYGVAVLVGRVWPVRERGGEPINDHPGFVHRMVALIIDALVMGICVYALGLGVTYLFYRVAVPLYDGRFTLGFLTVGTEVVEWVPRLLAVVAFLVFEVWMPWRHGGRSLGGMYTQMTCETVPRHGAMRVAFYCARTAVLGTWYILLVDGMRRSLFWWMTLALLVFWVCARKMPWDLVPGNGGAGGARTRVASGGRGEA
ncbi:MAG: VanZ family protein [Bifidobacterium sp.]|nr:VanZ family protein [Bifidobacterium sp.]